MLLFHATLRRNLRSIRRRGILTSFARGALRAVWLHTRSAATWAVLHTVRRHGGRVEDVVIIAVELPRSALRRSSVRRLWYTLADVRPSQIRSVLAFRAYASREGLCDGDDLRHPVSA